MGGIKHFCHGILWLSLSADARNFMCVRARRNATLFFKPDASYERLKLLLSPATLPRNCYFVYIAKQIVGFLCSVYLILTPLSAANIPRTRSVFPERRACGDIALVFYILKKKKAHGIYSSAGRLFTCLGVTGTFASRPRSLVERCI